MNVGLIGCGRVAQIHLDAYRSLSDVKVIAVSDLNLDKAKVFAKTNKIEKVFPDYVDLLEIKDLDCVDICTPTSTHASIVCDAARFGHNILVEKPMARNTIECKKMIGESEKSRVNLCVCHNQLFFPSVMQLKSLLDTGYLDLLSFRTSHREDFEFLKTHGFAHDWNISPEQGGILWEVGCHLAYLQLYFLQDIREVYAVGIKAKYPVHDEFMVILRTPDQRFGIMEISWVAKESEIVYEINSSYGERIQTYLPHGYIIEKSERPPTGAVDVLQSFYTDEKRILRKWIRFGLNRIGKTQPSGHFSLLAKYVESLRKDSLPPVTPQDGEETIRLLECIEKSLEKQQPVALNS